MIELPNKKYQIIYADPPWKYDDSRDYPTKNNPSGAGGASKHYVTMEIDDIKSLPVKEIVDENCMLFLWTTSPFMKKAIEVIEAWGFEFITIPFVWIKRENDTSEPRKDGIGSYTLNNAEYVLLGRKGKYWRNSTLVKQIILAPKGEHSRKPLETRNRIVQLLGDLPRIELFAREKTEGWDVWGLEAPKDTQMLIT
jgi:N6-adenosine-specific RNA methylase IME4